jgi:hypothetical protein
VADLAGMLVFRRKESVTSVPAVGAYRDRLCELLEQCDGKLVAEEREMLRAVVRERRYGRSQRLQASASAAVNARACEIVEVLESAARVLRPRETQSLDDFVAGVKAQPVAAPDYAPVRLRRRGL